MASRRFSCVLILSSSVFLLFSGCADPYGDRQEVSGAVSLKGAPLDEGVIEFHPLGTPTGNNVATKTGAVVTNGSYTIPRSSGLVPGKYKVLITAGDGKTPENTDEAPGPTGNFVSKDRIPAEYNVESKQEVEVSDSAPNVFNYDIP